MSAPPGRHATIRATTFACSDVGTTYIGGANGYGSIFKLDMGLGSFITFVRPTGKVGQTAQILGQKLTGTTSVAFNGVPATSFSFVSDTYMDPSFPGPGSNVYRLISTVSAGVPHLLKVSFEAIGAPGEAKKGACKTALDAENYQQPKALFVSLTRYMVPTIYAPGEILPPSSRSLSLAQNLSNEQLNYIATLLDDKFCIPGTRIRFGLDALIGWIPVIGDTLAAAASLFIVFAAWKRGVSRVTLLRMLMNLTIEASVGAIPLIGDFVHVAWKANRRNFNLLLRDQQEPRVHAWSDWLFVIAALLTMTVLFVGPLLLMIYLFRVHYH